jgi:hypothetical protein
VLAIALLIGAVLWVMSKAEIQDNEEENKWKTFAIVVRRKLRWAITEWEKSRSGGVRIVMKKR